jgi:proteasome lid subunit RPN8/RPN11
VETSLTKVVLTSSVGRQIEAEGVAAYPNECCGILIGKEKDGRRVVERLAPMKNVFDPGERYHRFTIDPLAQIEAEKSADEAGQVVLGYYHSHPDHPARPSEYDRTHVPPWSFYSHIIVAIEKGRPAEMTAWCMNEDTEQFASLELVRE